MMKPGNQIEEELFPFYALDALTVEERAEVEAYVAINPQARARLEALIDDAAHLGVGVEPVAPSPAVKQQLMQRVQQSAATQHAAAGESPRHPSVPTSSRHRSADRPRRGWFSRPILGTVALAGAALALFAILSAFLLRQQVNDLQAELQVVQSENAALEAQLEDLEVQNASLRQQLTTQQEILAIYQNPAAATLAISDTTGEHPQAIGRLTHAPDSESAVLVAANLEPLDEESVYQLWFIHGDTPVSGGTFRVDETGSGSLLVSAVQPGFDAVGVSIEPEGGSEQPTPDQIILFGPVS